MAGLTPLAMLASAGHPIVLARPPVVIATIWPGSMFDKKPVHPGYWACKGAAVSIFLIVSVRSWALFITVMPQLLVVDIRFRPKLSPNQMPSPWNIFTFENDRWLLHGSTRCTNNWDSLQLAAFAFGNTTTFAILADKALTTVLAGRVRQGTAPALSALAVAIIAVTVLGAIVYKAIKRREDTRREAVLRAAEALDAQEIVAA